VGAVRLVRVVGAALLAGACSAGGGDATTSESSTSAAQRSTDAVECRRSELPATEPVATADRVPGDPVFVDVTERAGLAVDELAPLPSCVPPTCTLNQPSLFVNYPEIDLAQDATGGAFCQMERFTGGVAVGDVDDDGDPDLAFSRLDGPVRLFVNAAGRFRDATAEFGLDRGEPMPTTGLAFADVDNDGDLDLAANTIIAARPLLYIRDEDGFSEQGDVRGFTPPTAALHAGYSIAPGDFDRDGFVDFYITEYLGASADDADFANDGRLLRNRGATEPGVFDDVTESAGASIAAHGPVYAFGASFADLDGDGWADLYVTGDFGTSRLFWNDGDGTFTESTEASGVGTEENGMGSATADVDGDGDLDRFVASVFDERGSSIAKGGNWGATGNRLFRNDGDRTFVDVTDSAGVRDGQWGWGSVFIDSTNSGRLDLVQASGLDLLISQIATPYVAAPTRYWRQRDDLRFVDIGAASGIDGRNARGVATLDADLDGRLDVILVGPGSAPRLYANVSESSGRSLRVVVRGRASGTDALGAVVRVRAGATTTVRTVGSVSDYLGQSESVVHIGIGGAEAIDWVEVEFPATGRRVRHDRPTPDSVVEVVEPEPET
jgi:enediyne biosynthesis protein E4